MKPSLQQTTEVERWWLCFCDSPQPGWWKWFCRPGFTHVYGFRMPRNGLMIALNPCVHRVENAVVFGSAAESIAYALEHGKVMVYAKRVTVYDPAVDKRVGRGLFLTCASVLAYTIGLDFAWRCTPFQLYQALRRAGAEEL